MLARVFQIAPPPWVLSTLPVDSLLLLPVQTVTVRKGVKPEAQASRNSLVVPVLTAAGLLSLSTLLRPKIGRRSKKLDAAVAEARAVHPGRPVEVWAEDKHRLGLKPVCRRVRAPKGERPTALGHHRFEWLHVAAFV